MLVKNSSIIMIECVILCAVGGLIYYYTDFDFAAGVIIGADFAALYQYIMVLDVAKKTLTEEERERFGIGQKREIKLR